MWGCLLFKNLPETALAASPWALKAISGIFLPVQQRLCNACAKPLNSPILQNPFLNRTKRLFKQISSRFQADSAIIAERNDFLVTYLNVLQIPALNRTRSNKVVLPPLSFTNINIYISINITFYGHRNPYQPGNAD